MKELEALKFARQRHGNNLDVNSSDVAHTINGFIEGWEQCYKSIGTKAPTDKNFEDVLQTVADTLSLTVEAIKSRTRDRDLVEAKVVFAMICKSIIFKCSHAKIGKYINRDHSSVVHYLNNLTGLVTKKHENCIEKYYEKYIK